MKYSFEKFKTLTAPQLMGLFRDAIVLDNDVGLGIDGNGYLQTWEDLQDEDALNALKEKVLDPEYDVLEFSEADGEEISQIINEGLPEFLNPQIVIDLSDEHLLVCVPAKLRLEANTNDGNGEEGRLIWRIELLDRHIYCWIGSFYTYTSHDGVEEPEEVKFIQPYERIQIRFNTVESPVNHVKKVKV